MAIYTYVGTLCDSCETQCIEELVPCLGIPVPDCGSSTLLASVSHKTKCTKTGESTLAPVPIEPLGTKAKALASKPMETKGTPIRLEPKPIATLSLRAKPATN